MLWSLLEGRCSTVEWSWDRTSAACKLSMLYKRTTVWWKSSNTNARLMASAPSLALDSTFGIHSHKTLDTAQPCHLLKPNRKASSHSISILTNISTQFLLQSVCVCVFVFVVRIFLIYFLKYFM